MLKNETNLVGVNPYALWRFFLDCDLNQPHFLYAEKYTKGYYDVFDVWCF